MTVKTGRAKVGVSVMVGVGVTVGVCVSVGVNVLVKVGVNVGVLLLVIVGVKVCVQDSAVEVAATDVIVDTFSGEGAHP